MDRIFTIALGTLGFSTSAQAQPIPLRISINLPESDPVSQSLRLFKEEMEKALPGQFDVQLYVGASALFRQFTELPAMRRGTLEMSFLSPDEFTNQIPEYGILSSGYLFRDPDHLQKVFRGPIGKGYYEVVAQKVGIQLLEAVYLGTRHISLRALKDVKTPADMSGVKLRVLPGPAWLVLGKGLGANPTPMPISEVYLALQTGTIDAHDNPVSITQSLKLHEVTKQIVLTSHLVQPLIMAIAKPFWDKLNPQQRDTLQKAARHAAEANDKIRIESEKESMAFLTKQGMVFKTPDIGAFSSAVHKQYAESGMAQKWLPGLRERIAAVK